MTLQMRNPILKAFLLQKRSFPHFSTPDNNEHISLSSGQATTPWIINNTVPFKRQSPDTIMVF